MTMDPAVGGAFFGTVFFIGVLVGLLIIVIRAKNREG